ncbi:hypothetical protein I6F15_00195 [Bradyrhizobium sp. BRP14]|nr:hypothetical protein [Bradyrhizobium sp. BRP14]
MNIRPPVFLPLQEALDRVNRGRQWYYRNRHRPGFPVGKNVHGRIYMGEDALPAYIANCPDNLPDALPAPTVEKRRPGRPRKITNSE